MTALAPLPARYEDVKRLCVEWAVERRRRLMRRRGGLTADQVADLRVMRWTDEARLLGDPGHVEAMETSERRMR